MNFSPTLLKASKIINAPIYNNSGVKIGVINDIAIYDRNGISAYLVSEIYEERIGREDELFAIPWSMFNLSESADNIVFSVEDEALVNAPSFSKEDWNKVNQNNLIVSIYNHFSKKNELSQQIDDYNLSHNKGIGNSGKIASIKDKSEAKSTIERAGIRDTKKSYIY